MWEVGSWTSKLDLEYLEPGATCDLCVCVLRRPRSLDKISPRALLKF